MLPCDAILAFVQETASTWCKPQHVTFAQLVGALLERENLALFGRRLKLSYRFGVDLPSRRPASAGPLAAGHHLLPALCRTRRHRPLW